MTVKSDLDLGRIPLLEGMRSQSEKTWQVLAPRYGVTNPNPPWKTSLTAMCDCLGNSGMIGAVELRHAEDEFGDALYSEVPDPERHLLAVAHTMLDRGLVTEGDLASRMSAVRSRLEAV